MHKLANALISSCVISWHLNENCPTDLQSRAPRHSEKCWRRTSRIKLTSSRFIFSGAVLPGCKRVLLQVEHRFCCKAKPDSSGDACGGLLIHSAVSERLGRKSCSWRYGIEAHTSGVCWSVPTVLNPQKSDPHHSCPTYSSQVGSTSDQFSHVTCFFIVCSQYNCWRMFVSGSFFSICRDKI